MSDRPSKDESAPPRMLQVALKKVSAEPINLEYVLLSSEFFHPLLTVE